MNGWTLEEAVTLCRSLEPALRTVGYYAAISGGVINKDGPRPDLDLVICERRMDSRKAADRYVLLNTLSSLGFVILSDNLDSFIVKGTWRDKPVDLRICEI